MDSRTGKTRAANPAKTARYERQLRLLLRAETELKPPDERSAFGVRLWFFRRGQRLCDLDNLEKSVMDAANGAVYLDDSQVWEKHSKLFLGCAEPRVEMVFYRLRKEQPC